MKTPKVKMNFDTIKAVSNTPIVFIIGLGGSLLVGINAALLYPLSEGIAYTVNSDPFYLYLLMLSAQILGMYKIYLAWYYENNTVTSTQGEKWEDESLKIMDKYIVGVWSIISILHLVSYGYMYYTKDAKYLEMTGMEFSFNLCFGIILIVGGMYLDKIIGIIGTIAIVDFENKSKRTIPIKDSNKDKNKDSNKSKDKSSENDSGKKPYPRRRK